MPADRPRHRRLRRARPPPPLPPPRPSTASELPVEHPHDQVVVPAPVDPAALPLAALLDEATGPVGGEGAVVEVDHLELDPVHAQRAEGVPQHQADRLGPQPLAEELRRVHPDPQARLPALLARVEQERFPDELAVGLDRPAQRPLRRPAGQVSRPTPRLRRRSSARWAVAAEAALDLPVPAVPLPEHPVVGAERAQRHPLAHQRRHRHRSMVGHGSASSTRPDADAGRRAEDVVADPDPPPPVPRRGQERRAAGRPGDHPPEQRPGGLPRARHPGSARRCTPARTRRCRRPAAAAPATPAARRRPPPRTPAADAE